MKKFKRIACLALALLCACQLGISPVYAEGDSSWPAGDNIDITSESAVVMEESTGTILYSKNMDEQMYPASITKIMTVLLAVENCSLDETVTFSSDSIYKTEGTNIARDVGEQMSLRDCVYAAELGSCNQCSYAIAEHVGGTMENFVQMMNDKAAALGCTGTHFNNPHGLPDDNHYTTAHDMALIAQAAYQNETFRTITGTTTYDIPPTNKHDEITPIRNHHGMLYPLKTREYLYEYATGGKTGYTTVAGSTLVTYAEKDGMTLVCVVMKTSTPNHYLDTTKLFNYCFNNFKLYNVAENETTYTNDSITNYLDFDSSSAYVTLDTTGNIVLPSTASFTDAQPAINSDNNSDTVVGSLSYTYDGRTVGGTNIITTGATVDSYGFDNVTDDSQESTEENTEESKTKTLQIDLKFMLLVACGIVLLVALIFGLVKLKENFYIIRYNQKEKRRRRQSLRLTKKEMRAQRRRGRRR